MDFSDQIRLSNIDSNVNYVERSISMLRQAVMELEENIVSVNDNVAALNLKQSLKTEFSNAADIPLDELSVLYHVYRTETGKTVSAMRSEIRARQQKEKSLKHEDIATAILCGGGILLTKATEQPWFGIVGLGLGGLNFIYSKYASHNLSKQPTIETQDVEKFASESANKFVKSIIERYDLRPQA